MHHLVYQPGLAPRRRLRGQRRYFAGVQRRAAAFVLEPGPTDWWAAWHYHADWRGWGNRGWRYRRAHLRALCRVFQTIVDARARFATPFQAWIHLADDAGSDAVFLHTPNPNGTPFPLMAEDPARPASSLLPFVQALLPGLTLELAVSAFDTTDDDDRPIRESVVWIWARGVGVPLAP